MREAVTKEIEGLKVTVQPWPARIAWRRQVTLGKVFGPSLKSLGAAIEGADTKEANIDLGAVGEAFADLFEKISEAKADEVLTLCLRGARVNDKEVTDETIDVQFESISQLYKSVAFVLEVNFGSFLGKGGIGKLLHK